MNDQLIDKMADAIVISMIKQGALTVPEGLTIKQAAIVGPGSWMAAGMQAMRNGLNPAQLAQLKRNTGRGGMIGAGIGTALGMIRGARQTAQQAGGWRNASFGQYAKNMAGQGAIGGIGGGVVGAGAGAVGTYGKNIYNAAKEIHGNDNLIGSYAKPLTDNVKQYQAQSQALNKQTGDLLQASKRQYLDQNPEMDPVNNTFGAKVKRFFTRKAPTSPRTWQEMEATNKQVESLKSDINKSKQGLRNLGNQVRQGYQDATSMLKYAPKNMTTYNQEYFDNIYNAANVGKSGK